MSEHVCPCLYMVALGRNRSVNRHAQVALRDSAGVQTAVPTQAAVLQDWELQVCDETCTAHCVVMLEYCKGANQQVQTA